MAKDTSDFLAFLNNYIGQIDYMSDYCHFHASFILRNIIPACHLRGKEPAKIAERVMGTIVAEGTRDKILFTGSASEGLRVPTFHYVGGITKEPGSTFETFDADVDLMYLVNGVKVQDTSISSNGDVELDPNNCHPGYVRLKVLTDNFNIADIDEPCSIYEGETAYLDSSKFHFDLYQARDNYGLSQGETRTYEKFIHGPAVSMETTLMNPQYNYKKVLSADLVPAIPCLFWPQAARAWISRRRVSSWPPPTLIDSITSKGCHVVPVAHSSSSLINAEWRLSFSAAELVLARSLIFIQRQSYILLKLICQEALMPKKIIPSYYLKTLLFWACEDFSTPFWHEENLSCILLTLLDRLIHHLSHGYLPNYFMPENNLLSHIPRHTISVLLQSAHKIRKDPIGILFKFNESKRVDSSRYPWRMAFQEVVQDMSTQSVKPSLMGTLKACGYSLHKMGFFNVLDNNYKLAESAYLQMATVMELYSGTTTDRLGFMSRQALCIPDAVPNSSLVSYANSLTLFYSYLFNIYSEHSSQTLLARDCGRLYLCLACMRRLDTWKEEDEGGGNDNDIGEENEDGESSSSLFSGDTVDAAERMLCKAKDGLSGDEYTPVLCDLVMLHYLAQDYSKAQKYAREVLEQEDVMNTPGWNMYGMLECCLFEQFNQEQLKENLPEPLSVASVEQIIRSTGQVLVPSIVIALYMLICIATSTNAPTKDIEVYLSQMSELSNEVGSPACLALLEQTKRFLKPR